jgi:diamine N-acetyltransferase
MINGSNVSLRALERRHLDATRAWANDAEMARLLDRAWPVSDMEHEAWFSALQKQRDRVYFAIENLSTGRHVGNVWLWDIDPRHRKAEVRIVLGDTEALGRGLGSESIDLIANYGFDRLNLHRVFAFVLSTNKRACRAFEKAQFEVEGTLKQDRWTGKEFTDVFLLGRLA